MVAERDDDRGVDGPMVGSSLRLDRLVDVGRQLQRRRHRLTHTKTVPPHNGISTRLAHPSPTRNYLTKWLGSIRTSATAGVRQGNEWEAVQKARPPKESGV